MLNDYKICIWNHKLDTKNIKNVQVVFCRVKQTGKYRKKLFIECFEGVCLCWNLFFSRISELVHHKGRITLCSPVPLQHSSMPFWSQRRISQVSCKRCHIISYQENLPNVSISAVKDTPDVLCINTLWIISDCPFQN